MNLSDNLLEIDGVSVERNANRILDRISLRIPRGRHTVILGPNGSGKTSLLKLLLRGFYPSVEDDGHQGIVRILGRDDWQVAELRRRMGIVSSTLDHAFTWGRTGNMTVDEAVASGFTATELPEFGRPLTDDVRAAITQALHRVGESHLVGRRVSTLSTGERRRVLIARALVHEPEILVLDEPTSGLDIAASDWFLKSLRSTLAGSRVTLVLVTHHIDEIIPEIRDVVLLDRGRVVASGAKEEILTRERLSKLFQIEIGLRETDDGFYHWVR